MSFLGVRRPRTCAQVSPAVSPPSRKDESKDYTRASLPHYNRRQHLLCEFIYFAAKTPVTACNPPPTESWRAWAVEPHLMTLSTTSCRSRVMNCSVPSSSFDSFPSRNTDICIHTCEGFPFPFPFQSSPLLFSFCVFRNGLAQSFPSLDPKYQRVGTFTCQTEQSL